MTSEEITFDGTGNYLKRDAKGITEDEAIKSSLDGKTLPIVTPDKWAHVIANSEETRMLGHNMTEEERAVWIGERLFNLKHEVIETTTGLWDAYEWSPKDGFGYENHSLLEYESWLSSPDGIAAVKARMIDRGYSIYLDYNAESKEWCCDFFFPKKHQGKHGASEAEAVLAACEKALRGEVSENR